MIPAMNIVAWGRNVPWVEQRQVEQDLIISRALVELFNACLSGWLPIQWFGDNERGWIPEAFRRASRVSAGFPG